MDELFDYLRHDFTWFMSLACLINVIVGRLCSLWSHYYPLQLQYQWHIECHEFLGSQSPPLNRPRFKAHHNASCDNVSWISYLPWISYFYKRGRYPQYDKRFLLIEWITTVSGMVVAWHYGPGIHWIAASLFTWLLIVLSAIDMKHQILPDPCNYILMWLGLALSVPSVFIDPEQAIWGALVSYCGLWFFARMFLLITGREGMGHGDFKLLAATATWTGPMMIPMILTTAAGSALIYTIVYHRSIKSHLIPFGPFLSWSSWCALLWGHDIMMFLY